MTRGELWSLLAQVIAAAERKALAEREYIELNNRLANALHDKFPIEPHE